MVFVTTGAVITGAGCLSFGFSGAFPFPQEIVDTIYAARMSCPEISRII